MHFEFWSSLANDGCKEQASHPMPLKMYADIAYPGLGDILRRAKNIGYNVLFLSILVIISTLKKKN